MCESGNHEFWTDSVSLLEEKLFRIALIPGHQKITDAHLLALAVRNRGKLATFDRSIPLKAVIDASAEHLEVLGTQS
jgi:predicted nucleic acid-binding protein